MKKLVTDETSLTFTAKEFDGRKLYFAISAHNKDIYKLQQIHDDGLYAFVRLNSSFQFGNEVETPKPLLNKWDGNVYEFDTLFEAVEWMYEYLKD